MPDRKINHKLYPGLQPPGVVTIMKQLELIHETHLAILDELKKINSTKEIAKESIGSKLKKIGGIK